MLENYQRKSTFISAFTLKLNIPTWRWTHYDQHHDVYATIDLKIDRRITLLNPQSHYRITPDTIFEEPPNYIPKTVELKFRAKEDRFGMLDDQPPPIKINAQVTFDDINCQSSGSKLECPMLSPNVNSNCLTCKRDIKIELKTGCADKNACRCNLNFILDKQPGSKVIVEKTKSIDLAFKVTNQGTEPAFEATIVFASKVAFPTIQGPRGLCSDLNKEGRLFRMECSLRKLKANSETLFTFKFNLPANFTGATDFTIQATLKDKCNGIPNAKNLGKELDFELEYKTDFKVSSVVSESQIM